MELILDTRINLESIRITIIQLHNYQIWRPHLVKFIIITIQTLMQPKAETPQPKTKPLKKAQTHAHKRVYHYYQTTIITIFKLTIAEIKLTQKHINYKKKSMQTSASTQR